MLQGKFQTAAHIVLYAVFALYITIANLGLTRSFVGDDVGITYYYPESLKERATSMWEERNFPGISSAILATAFPYFKIVFFLYQLGFNNIFVERFLYFSFLFLSPVGLYFLFLRLTKGNMAKNLTKNLAAFVAGSVYMLNYLAMVMIAFPLTNYHVSYILFPWILLLYIKNFCDKSGFVHLFIFMSVLLLLFAGNPSNTLSILGFVFIYALIFRREYKAPKWKLLLLSILLILSTSYIYLPLWANRTNPYIGNTEELNTASLSFNSVRSSFLNLFRFHGYHSAETFTFYNLYNHNLLYIIASFFVPLLVIISTLFKDYSVKERFFLILALGFMFLAKGIHEPFSDSFLFLFKKIFVLQMYRATYFKFEYYVIFCFAILLGFFVLKVSTYLKSSFAKFSLYIIPVIVLISVAPLIKGDVARYFHKSLIPNDYNEVRKYMKNTLLDSKVLSMPQVPGALLKWGEDNYFAGQYYLDNIILDRPVWSTTWFNKDLPTYFSDGKELDQGLKILGTYNTKFLLLHKDIPEDYTLEVGFVAAPGGLSAYHRIAKMLEARADITKIMNTSKFNLYELDNSNFLQRIYIPRNIYISEETKFNVLNVVPSNSLTSQRTAVYFMAQNKETNNKLRLVLSKVSIGEKSVVEYKKLSPTKYRVNIHSAFGLTPIVFSESYHAAWKIYQIPYVKPPAGRMDISTYKVFPESSGYQMNSQELTDALSDGYISTLGDLQTKIRTFVNFIPRDPSKIKIYGKDEIAESTQTYTIDFISKNINGTIQNNNLADDSITSFITRQNRRDISQITETFHGVANSYANSWVLDVNQLCEKDSLCQKNGDGTYDISLYIEFTPQRYFIIGLFIAGITIFSCISYIVVSYIKSNYIKAKF